MALQFYNTLTREKSPFTPLDPNHVRIYACGPTVYDRIHVGNARPIVIFDVLVRLLRHHYPKVTYVRNITDIDDKINARAAEQGIPIRKLTESTIKAFHDDCEVLNSLAPDHEPRATDHIDEMITMIASLIEKGHAYHAEGHVLFHVASMPNYGQLSRRTPDDLLAGARVEIAPYKKDAGDFVLWKPSDKGQPSWPSPWGNGRPGWHIECSAMSKKYLGEVFDIHAGGLDLIFPHHENEIAQSCCAHGQDKMAQFWMHNGYVTMNGEKMSKSLGHFITVNDVLEHGYYGESIRYALLSAHYRAPLDFSPIAMNQSESALYSLYRTWTEWGAEEENGAIDQGVLDALNDDLNTPKALARLHELAKLANKGDKDAAFSLKPSAALLGLLQEAPLTWLRGTRLFPAEQIEKLIKRLDDAQREKNYEEADDIRDALLKTFDIILEDTPQGTIWHKIDIEDIEGLVKARDDAKRGKDYVKADKIRAKLLDEYGIILEDTPQGTTWRKNRKK